jgi:hypothetical protein
MKEQKQFNSDLKAEAFNKNEAELSPKQIREVVEGAMARIKEGVPEGGKRIFEKGEVPYGTMFSHYADMIISSACVFANISYLTDEERLLLLGRESNILYIAGFLDRQTNGRLQLESVFEQYFNEKISPQDRRRYRLSKATLKILRLD